MVWVPNESFYQTLLKSRDSTVTQNESMISKCTPQFPSEKELVLRYECEVEWLR